MKPLAAEGIELFVPQMYDVFWSFVILLVLVLFFYKFFLPKFQAIFDERAKKIQGNIDKAAKDRQDATAAKKHYEQQVSQARVEASKIRDDARAEASHIISDARNRAQAEANQITTNAERSIDSQRRQALVSLRGEVGALATALAGKILGTKLQDDSVQSSMIDSVLQGFDDSSKSLKS